MKIYMIEEADIVTAKTQLDDLYAKKYELPYPIEIMIEGFSMGTRCWNSDQLVWFRHGFEVALGLMDLPKKRKTTKR